MKTIIHTPDPKIKDKGKYRMKPRFKLLHMILAPKWYMIPYRGFHLDWKNAIIIDDPAGYFR